MADASTICEICTWGRDNLVNFWVPAAASAVGGALGGLAECATHVKLSAGKMLYDAEEASAAQMKVLRRTSALIGWAGAWGVLFIFVATRWWEDEAKRGSLALFILTLSVAGGFGARRLLPHLADRLKQQIDETNLKVDKVEKKAEAAQGAAVAAIESSTRTDLLSRARATVATPAATLSDIFKSAEELKGLIQANPLDRGALIPLGNLFSKANQLPTAIATMTSYIEAKSKVGQRDEDLSAALFNRACYNTKLWKDPATEPAIAEKCRKRAISDLKESFRIAPKNYADAQIDTDLTPLLNDPDYLDMVKELIREGVLKDA